MASNQPPVTTHSQGHADQHISQQQTLPHVAANSPQAPLPIPVSPADPTLPSQPSITRRLRVIIPIAIVLLLLLGIYFVWNTSTPSSPLATNSSGITQQNFGSSPAATTSSNSGNIQVYIVGAVLHPGVYTLAAGARVYALLQAAGGPLPKANLVALNLAAKLTDGEEVYVTMIGEIPPTYLGGVPGPGTGTPNNAATGQLVNINTASVTEMRQNLHVSSTTAQNIVNYRTQHGPFTSIDQLLQVVSKSIYDHIKGLVTIS